MKTHCCDLHHDVTARRTDCVPVLHHPNRIPGRIPTERMQAETVPTFMSTDAARRALIAVARWFDVPRKPWMSATDRAR
jgi:hypothetical protein